MNDLISVIIPVYKVEDYLSRCVDSVLAQTYRNLEIVLVDDGSPDRCPELCDAYARQDERVKVIHKKNGGLSSARNAGIDAACGDYISFVDSDDCIVETMYEDLLCAVKTGATLANARYERLFPDGTTAPSRVPHIGTDEITGMQFAEELLLHTGDVSVCTKLFPKAFFQNLRFPEGVLNEDLLFFFSALERIDTIRFTGKVGYYYFVRSGSISGGSGKSLRDMVSNALTVRETVYKNYPALTRQADRFALIQHSAYLLNAPCDGNAGDPFYFDVLQYLRKNAMKNRNNPYLTARDKAIIFSLAIFPRSIRRLKRRKDSHK